MEPIEWIAITVAVGTGVWIANNIKTLRFPKPKTTPKPDRKRSNDRD